MAFVSDDAPGRPGNTGNLAALGDVDEIGRRLDDVPVGGLLDGKPGAVGLPHDARVMPTATLVEPFQQFGAHSAGGAAQSGGGKSRPVVADLAAAGAQRAGEGDPVGVHASAVGGDLDQVADGVV